MASSSSTNGPPSPNPNDRRASFSPHQSLSGIFGRSPPPAATGAGNISNGNGASGGNSGPTSAYPGPITAAAAASAQASEQRRRRMSISTLGLSGSSPSQSSPFGPGGGGFGGGGGGGGPGRFRRSSMSSGSSDSPGESAIDDSADGPSLGSSNASPFARRMSFGARAMWDARSSLNGSDMGGFNWSEQIRARAERSTSFAGGASPTLGQGAFGRNSLGSLSSISSGSTANGNHHKANSVALPAEPPIHEMPKQPKAPDHFQERILKGDFYMD